MAPCNIIIIRLTAATASSQYKLLLVVFLSFYIRHQSSALIIHNYFILFQMSNNTFWRYFHSDKKKFQIAKFSVFFIYIIDIYCWHLIVVLFLARLQINLIRAFKKWLDTNLDNFWTPLPSLSHRVTNLHTPLLCGVTIPSVSYG